MTRENPTLIVDALYGVPAPALEQACGELTAASAT